MIRGLKAEIYRKSDATDLHIKPHRENLGERFLLEA